MSSQTLPATLDQAHAIIEQLQWRVHSWRSNSTVRAATGRPRPRLFPKNRFYFRCSRRPPNRRPYSEVALEELPATSEAVRARHPARTPSARVLETLTQRIEPEEKVCPHCGKEKCEIGCEKSERYEYIPAKVIRHEIIRPKLACQCGQAGVSIAPLPPALIRQGCADSSLVAQVILAKYVDHLPLYRQQQILSGSESTFPRDTGGLGHAGSQLAGTDCAGDEARTARGDYLQADETPVAVMDPDVKGKTAKGYLWVMGLPGGNVVFEFHPGRGKAEAKKAAGRLQRLPAARRLLGLQLISQ